MSFQPGDPIRVEVTKWGDRPHWEFDGTWLGSDEYGEWLGFPAGTPHARPGMAFDSAVDTVTLVPRDQHWLATFHAPGIWCDLYIDVSTPARWDGSVLRTVDLDLDVIRMSTSEPEEARPPGLTAGLGEVFIDDEDEFLEHQVGFGYPAEVVAAARTSADELEAAVRAGAAPYDGKAHLPWLAQVR
ncbi:DUF402 domain-containing protein [Nocardioides currus]|uniref:DUF402 domain-containing protein n=1 Tax=Nocardioides currus TaxID=2133958 RepID=A0A2R7Z1A8_9ACTN|nr:DUF402 domain-containing protein [Nocardioides currus]PUA82405.1 DUF402 domain-containing protein [Nocardioides currus]